MNLLAALLLIGFLAYASAYPLETSEYGLVESELEDFPHDNVFAAEETSIEDVKKQLRERLNEILLKIKDAIDHGRAVKEDLAHQVKEVREKLKALKGDLGEDLKKLLEKVKEGSREYMRKLLERLGLDTRSVHEEFTSHAEEYSDIVDELKNKFQDIVQKLKDAFEQGKNLKDGLDQLQQIREKLKDLNIDLGDKGREFLDKLKDKVKDYWNKLKERLTTKRNADIDIFGMLNQLKEMIHDEFNADRLKTLVEKYLGKGSELAKHFIEVLKEKGEKRKEKLLEWIHRVLGDEEVHQGALKDVYEKVKNYFKDLNIELKEKFVKFGEWIKERYGEKLEKGKSKLASLRDIAQSFIDDTRDITHDVAEETLVFLRPYKEDLGTLYENVKNKVRDIVKKKE